MSERFSYLRPFNVCNLLREIATPANKEKVGKLEAYLLRLENACMEMHKQIADVRFAVRETPLIPSPLPFHVIPKPHRFELPPRRPKLPGPGRPKDISDPLRHRRVRI